MVEEKKQKKNGTGRKVHLVRADNDEEEEERTGKGKCQNWAQVAQTLLIGREIRVGPKSLRENTFRGRLKLVQKSSSSSEKR